MLAAGNGIGFVVAAVAVLGLGVMGGSLCRALRDTGLAEEAVRLPGTYFLQTKAEMEAFAEAVRKIQTHSKEILTA